MENNKITNKTADELLSANKKDLTQIEDILRELIISYDMTLEEAIAALDELP